jgi:hypothetical protein
MNLPPNNSTAKLEKKYQYILNAVFFHRSNSYYLYTRNPTNINAAFGKNLGKCINVFLQGKKAGSSSACAVMEGNRAVSFNGVWDEYINPADAMWVKAGTLNHEIGHNLSLIHTLIPKDDEGKRGNCNGEDYCSDTPTSDQLIPYNIFPCDDCPRWGTSTYCPNNQMGYSGHSALTPLQLGRVHWTIENEMSSYKSCFAPYLNISLTSFTDNSSYICTSLTIPSGSSILVNNNKSLYISTENFNSIGTLNVAVGSTLVIKPLSGNCN